MTKMLHCSAVLFFAFHAMASTLPFEETFEGLTGGTVHGQNNWIQQGGTGTANVQSAVSYGQSGNALEIRSETVSHALSSSNSSIWISFQARVTAAPETDPVVTNPNTSVAFFVNTNLHLVVYNGTNRVELGAQVTTDWTRFDVYCDYSRSKWLLNINSNNVASDLDFYSSGTQVESLVLANHASSPVYLDELAVLDTEPSAGISDTDSDGLPDWWELCYFGSTTAAVQSNTVANGMTCLQAYTAGLSPVDSSDLLTVTRGVDRKLKWTRKPGRQYDIYWTSNLTSGFTCIYSAVAGNELEDSEYADRPAGFYQIRARK